MLTNFPIAKAHESVTLAKLMGSRVQCSQMPCSESHFCLFPDNNPKISRGEPTEGRAPQLPVGSGVAWLPCRQTWHRFLPAQHLPSPAPRSRIRKLASLIFLCNKVLVAFPQVVLLVYHWSSRESERHLLVHKAVARWTAEEVVLWLEQLGPWASLYRDRFISERVNGR